MFTQGTGMQILNETNLKARHHRLIQPVICLIARCENSSQTEQTKSLKLP